MRRTIPGLLILAAAVTLSPAVRAESVLRVAMTLAECLLPPWVSGTRCSNAHPAPRDPASC
jgi:hypothetical protein